MLSGQRLISDGVLPETQLKVMFTSVVQLLTHEQYHQKSHSFKIQAAMTFFVQNCFVFPLYL